MVHCIATQNVDGFIRKQDKNVYELRGNIRTVRCEDCSDDGKLEDFIMKRIVLAAEAG